MQMLSSRARTRHMLAIVYLSLCEKLSASNTPYPTTNEENEMKI